MAKAASFFTKFASLYVTKVVENLAEGRSCSEDDSFCTLDPRGRPGEAVDLKGQKYPEVIVFIMGGGCYSEFFNLQDLLKHKATSGSILRNVLYGSTELLAGDDFCAQLQKLGSVK
jgi:sec1 family domain-containing protein 1